MAAGEVGKVGVAIDSLPGHGNPVQRHPARPGDHVDDYQRHRRHPSWRSISQWPKNRAYHRRNSAATVQNDILKEYIARGTYIYPPQPSMRLITDLFAYCERELPRWNTISISGYHIREAGSTAAQEVAIYVGRRHRLRASGDRNGLGRQ